MSFQNCMTFFVLHTTNIEFLKNVFVHTIKVNGAQTLLGEWSLKVDYLKAKSSTLLSKREEKHAKISQCFFMHHKQCGREIYLHNAEEMFFYMSQFYEEAPHGDGFWSQVSASGSWGFPYIPQHTGITFYVYLKQVGCLCSESRRAFPWELCLLSIHSQYENYVALTTSYAGPERNI